VLRYIYGCGDRGAGKGMVAVLPGRLNNYCLAAWRATWGRGGVLLAHRGRLSVVGRPGLGLASLLGPHGMLPPTILGGWLQLGLPGSPGIPDRWGAIG